VLTFPEAAERMGISLNAVKQLVTEHRLLAVRTENGLLIPEEVLDGTVPVMHLVGVLTLLHDAGYTPEEAYGWLTTPDDSLPGTPLQALHENRATEIKRRAQALAF
jgi:excisionase family DNA binding protein